MATDSVTFEADGLVGPYGVQLEIFQGPLDLLLFLIRKDEVDVYDIPIAGITRQFLSYVELIQDLNLEQAGDFVLMAAMLMKIKSRMLLPIEQDEEGEEIDPREELVRRLLEYQQYKDVAGWLEDQQDGRKDVYYRGASINLEEVKELALNSQETLYPASLFDLLIAFKHAMDAAPKIDFHQVGQPEVSTQERVDFIHEMLNRNGQTSFFELVQNESRMVIIVTFVALLELMKGGQVRIQQTGVAGEIWIYPKEQSSENVGSEHHA